ncbi:unnamed protein product [Effrenium voratum]|nr:unnamed protein product [Effrenium voratum]
MSGVDGLHLLAFFIGVALTVTLFAAVHFALVNRRSSRVIEEGWKDAERGEGKSSEKDASRDVKAMCHKLQLAMELQMRQGCTAQEVSDRLDHILQLVEAPTLRESAMPIVEETDQGQAQPSKGSVADTRTPSSSNRSSSERSEDLPGVVAMPPDKMGKEPLPPPLPPTTLEPLKASRDKQFGPTERQLDLPDPPEKGGLFDEDEAHRHSLHTLQRVLSKRDAQTTELHHQLRETRQELWQQSAEARAATARLNTYLADVTKAPQEQAEAILRLQNEVQDLSGQLAEARHQEKQWAAIANRQRAFFRQSEVLAQEGMQILRRHPAGEIFLAPPPVVLDDDEPQDEPMWDVGTSHCNPYCVDSWPFEPNVLAAKASAQPNLNHWDEGDEDDEYDDIEEDDEDQEPQWHQDPRWNVREPEDETVPDGRELRKAPHGTAGMIAQEHSDMCCHCDVREVWVCHP